MHVYYGKCCKVGENVVFEDKTVLYDGQAHSLEPKNMPEGSRVSYRRLDGGNGTNTFTEVGSYSIEARIIHHNYNEKKLTATLTIRSYSSLYGVDTSKQAFVFDNELVWNDVFGEILKSNYTLKMYSGTRQSEEEDYLLKDSESYTKVVCDGKESLIESYSPTDGFYKYVLFMIKDNDAIRYEADFTRDDIYFDSKMPKEAMDETVLKYYPARAFVGLQEVNGMVAPGVDLDDFYGNVGTFTVKDNRLIIKHEHKRENGTYFYDVYEFSNVGNSKLDLPRSLLPSDKEIEKLSRVSKFYIYGVQYREALVSTWNSPTEFMAHTYLYYWQQLILEPGAHFVYPAIYDRKVERVVYTFYSETNVYNFNMSGYELNVCFDNQGNYQGEYAKLGTVTDRTSNFVSHGGVVHYYDEWATN